MKICKKNNQLLINLYVQRYTKDIVFYVHLITVVNYEAALSHVCTQITYNAARYIICSNIVKEIEIE